MESRQRSAIEVDHAFAKHKQAMEDLYLVRKLALHEVIDIMTREHNFRASAKMYKTRFKKWGWRKNIHIKQQEYLELLNTRTKKGSSVPQKEIKLPNGLVVNHNRLSVYLDRKSRREQYAKAVQRPVFICYPGTSRGLEMVLTQVQKLIYGGYRSKLQSLDDADILWSSLVDAELFSSVRFTYAVGEALSSPDTFNDGMVLLRQAPQRLSTMLQNEAVIVTSDFFAFIVYLTRPRTYQSIEVKNQFFKVVRALFQFAICTFEWPPSHPSHILFQGFLMTEDDDLHEVAVKAWELVGHTMSEILLDDVRPTGTPVTVFRPTKSSSEKRLTCLVNETIRHAVFGYRCSGAWRLDSLYSLDDNTVDEHNVDGPDSTINKMVNDVCTHTVKWNPQGGTKVMLMKAMFDAHGSRAAYDVVERRIAEKYMLNCIDTICEQFGPQCDPLAIRYAAELEDTLRRWGEVDRATQMARWRGEMERRSQSPSGGRLVTAQHLSPQTIPFSPARILKGSDT